MKMCLLSNKKIVRNKYTLLSSATETSQKDRWGFDDPGGNDPGLAVPMRTHRDREKKWMHMLQPSKWQKERILTAGIRIILTEHKHTK